jgi:hypothetical protein
MAPHRYNVPIHQEVSIRYASDLTDQEFVLIYSASIRLAICFA